MKELSNKELNHEENDFLRVEETATSEHRSDDNHEKKIENVTNSRVSHSGNSNVTINITIDLLPLAFAQLYSLYATKQISSDEFELALSKLKEFLKDTLND